MSYHDKYLKYKSKYTLLRNKLGGSNDFTTDSNAQSRKVENQITKPVSNDSNTQSRMVENEVTTPVSSSLFNQIVETNKNENNINILSNLGLLISSTYITISDCQYMSIDMLYKHIFNYVVPIINNSADSQNKNESIKFITQYVEPELRNLQIQALGKFLSYIKNNLDFIVNYSYIDFKLQKIGVVIDPSKQVEYDKVKSILPKITDNEGQMYKSSYFINKSINDLQSEMNNKINTFLSDINSGANSAAKDFMWDKFYIKFFTPSVGENNETTYTLNTNNNTIYQSALKTVCEALSNQLPPN